MSSLCLIAKVWSQSVLCSLIITCLIKAKLTAASTGLFANNCQDSRKIAHRKQNQSHIYLKCLKQDVKGRLRCFSRASVSLRGKLTNIPNLSLFFTEYGDFCEDIKERENFAVDAAVITDKHCLDERDDVPTPFPGKWVGISTAWISD